MENHIYKSANHDNFFRIFVVATLKTKYLWIF